MPHVNNQSRRGTAAVHHTCYRSLCSPFVPFEHHPSYRAIYCSGKARRGSPSVISRGQNGDFFSSARGRVGARGHVTVTAWAKCRFHHETHAVHGRRNIFHSHAPRATCIQFKHAPSPTPYKCVVVIFPPKSLIGCVVMSICYFSRFRFDPYMNGESSIHDHTKIGGPVALAR